MIFTFIIINILAFACGYAVCDYLKSKKGFFKDDE